MFKIIILVIFSLSVFSKEVEKSFRVVRIQKGKLDYSIYFNESAPVYHAKKKHIKCLAESLESKKFVTVKFDIKKFDILECYASKK